MSDIPQPPEPTRCPKCGTSAAEIVCHLCGYDKLTKEAERAATERVEDSL